MIFHRNSPERGFSLIEAMIGLLIMSFGILALAGMQITLSRNADVSKQRVEAMRLAQQRMETMRSFTHIAAVTATPVDPDRNGTPKLAWNDLASANDVNNPLTSVNFSNTSFTRSWAVGGAMADSMRPVSVTVGWTDRAGEAQSITLNSVISQSDPSNVASLGFPLPNNTNLKLPKNRFINIPVPAIDLGGGKSSYQISPTLAVVFSNLSGNVVEKCTTQVTATSYAAGTAGCTQYNGYILAGYVSGAIANSSTPIPTRPTGINTAAASFDNTGGNVISCTYAVTKDQSTSANILTSHYYLCLIPVTTGGGTWSGTIRLGGVPTDSNYKVCRFEYAGAVTDSDAVKNSRNVQPYVSVNASLDNQNYYIDNSSGANCPTVQGLPTILHQDCRNSGSPSATNCPLTANNASL